MLCSPLSRIGLALLVGITLGSFGCGGPAPTGAPTSPVKGRVTFQGKPVTKGTITFEPEGAGKEASGEIQADGTFVLTTYKKDDGAVLGNHRVSVANAGKSVPVKFASFQTSHIEMEVSEGKTEYNIDLK